MVARTTKKLLAPMTIHNIIASRSGRAPTDFIVEGASEAPIRSNVSTSPLLASHTHHSETAAGKPQ